MTRIEIGFLTVLTLALWALMPATQLWDWDEPLYGRTGIEMFQAGNLLLPRFNGEVFAHKPPMGYWIMGAAAQIFGPIEFAVRFFSAPALAFSALMIGRSGAVLFTPRVGHIAMIVSASGFLSIYLGAAAMMDAFLMAGYTLCSWVVLKIMVQGRTSVGLLALFALGGLVTLLVKGPVGPALLGTMVLASFLALRHGDRPGWGGFWLLVLAGGVALLGFLAWFVPANAASGGALVREGVGIHIIGRALAPMEGHGGQGLLGFLLFLPVYIPVILLGLIPWTMFLPAALTHVFKGMDRKPRVLLLTWFLPTFVIFSVAATKLPHYIFPAVAPLSVAIAAYLVNSPTQRTCGGRTMTAALYLVLAAVLVWAAVSFSETLAVPMLALAALGFVLAALAVWRFPVAQSSVLPLALVGLATMQLFYWGGLREVEPLVKVSRPLGQAIRTHAPQDALVISGRYREPSLVFYADRPVDNPIRHLAPIELVAVISEARTGYAVVTEAEASLLMALPIKVTVLAEAAAWNFNQNGAYQPVFLLAWQHALD